MGKSTGSDLTSTANRVKGFLNKKATSYKNYPNSYSLVVGKASRIAKKFGDRVAKKSTATPESKKDIARWNRNDFMGKIVDWKEKLGNLLLESALVEGSVSSKKALRRLKFSAKRASKDDDEKRDLGYNTYKKWHKKKMIRAQSDSYKTKLGDES